MRKASGNPSRQSKAQSANVFNDSSASASPESVDGNASSLDYDSDSDLPSPSPKVSKKSAGARTRAKRSHSAMQAPSEAPAYDIEMLLAQHPDQTPVTLSLETLQGFDGGPFRRTKSVIQSTRQLIDRSKDEEGRRWVESIRQQVEAERQRMGNTNQRRTSGRRGVNDPSLNEDEVRRKQMRRERNKLAAAKCRRRRLEHTLDLLTEVDKLDQLRSDEQAQVEKLQAVKAQLAHILNSHTAECALNVNSTNIGDDNLSGNHALTGAAGAKESFLMQSTAAAPVDLSHDSVYSVAAVTQRPTSLALVGNARASKDAPAIKQEMLTAAAPVSLTTPGAVVFDVLNGTGLTPFGSGTGLTPISDFKEPLQAQHISGELDTPMLELNTPACSASSYVSL